MGERTKHRPLLADEHLPNFRLRPKLQLQGILQLEQMPEELRQTFAKTVRMKGHQEFS